MGQRDESHNMFLMIDNEEIKGYDNQTQSWIKIGDIPVTVEMFELYGVRDIPNIMEGLSSKATLLFYTEDDELIDNKKDVIVEVKQVVTSKAKVIEMNKDFHIHNQKSIKEIFVDVDNTRKDGNTNVITEGKIRVALSFNGGATYFTFNKIKFVYEEIDINSSLEFLEYGIMPDDLDRIDYKELNLRALDTRLIRIAYILDKPDLSDVCRLKKVKILYD